MPKPGNPHGLVVGQKLWLVTASRWFIKTNCEVEIKKIGRKYGHFEWAGRELRFELDRMHVISDTGNGCLGYLFESKSEWEHHDYLERQWYELKELFDDSRYTYNRKPPATFDPNEINPILIKWFGEGLSLK